MTRALSGYEKLDAHRVARYVDVLIENKGHGDVVLMGDSRSVESELCVQGDRRLLEQLLRQRTSFARSPLVTAGC
ncbi:hypothetical protein [Xanthomonas nasturtii]|uniref:hypothetical protein n=1 Tax=Xanthomonas nasturtii TaxID=1843581 RepID=UPI0009EDD974|nr:hypothetical protein [Xanthomonas nasturtii]WVL58062.1 hypothetical protein M3O54_007415 [Xanthomonas nasturtii]